MVIENSQSICLKFYLNLHKKTKWYFVLSHKNS